VGSLSWTSVFLSSQHKKKTWCMCFSCLEDLLAECRIDEMIAHVDIQREKKRVRCTLQR